MAAITILLVLGICIFLIWFFESILTDAQAYDSSEAEYVTLRREYSAAPQRTHNTGRQSSGYAARQRGRNAARQSYRNAARPDNQYSARPNRYYSSERREQPAGNTGTSESVLNRRAS